MSVLKKTEGKQQHEKDLKGDHELESRHKNSGVQINLCNLHASSHEQFPSVHERLCGDLSGDDEDDGDNGENISKYQINQYIYVDMNIYINEYIYISFKSICYIYI